MGSWLRPFVLARAAGARRAAARAADLARDPALWLGLLLVGLAYATMRFDRNPINGYWGDDGRDYIDFVQHVDDYVGQAIVSRYAITRVLPVRLVRALVDWRGLPLSAPSIIDTFQRANAAVSAVAMVAFVATMRRLAVSLEGRVLGVVVAMSSYALAKSPYFYAQMVDTFVIGLGALLVWAYVARRPFVLLLVTFASAFSWPYILQAFGFVLLAFCPRAPRPFAAGDAPGLPSVDRAPRPTLVTWAAVAAVGAALVVVLAFGLQAREPTLLGELAPADGSDRFAGFHRYDPVYWGKDWVLVALGITFVTGLVPAFALFRGLTVREVLVALRPGWAALGLGALQVASHLRDSWSEARMFTEEPKVKVIVQYALTLQRPGQALVGHLAYFGVAAVLAVVVFGDVARVARRLGPGYAAFAMFALFLLLTSESRQEAPVLLMLLPVVVKAVDLRGVRWHVVVLAALAGLAASGVWLDARDTDPAEWTRWAPFLEWPLQHYFLHHGITMGDDAFRWYGRGFLALGVVFAFLLRRGRGARRAGAGERRGWLRAARSA